MQAKKGLLPPAGDVYCPARGTSHLLLTTHTCRHEEALQAFAEDVYYCSLEHGPEEVRTSLGYYNLAKVFQGAGSMDRALACTDQVGELQRGLMSTPVVAWGAQLCWVINSQVPEPQRPGGTSYAKWLQQSCP